MRAAAMAAGLLQMILYIVLLLLLLNAGNAQQEQPFRGLGSTPPSDPTDVYISATLDRLLSVDDRGYRFTAILFIIISWTDPRTYSSMLASLNSTCKNYCSTTIPSSNSCCDNIWKPAIYLNNAILFSEERILYEELQIGGRNNSGVQWVQRLLGTYSSAMNFKSFPFDSQELTIEMEAKDSRVRLHSSSVGLSTGIFKLLGQGDDVSGWRVASMSISVRNGSVSASKDEVVQLSSNDPLPYCLLNPNCSSATETSVADIVLLVKRLNNFFVINMVIPIAFTVALSWSVFLIDPQKVGTRVTITLSLFFALVSLTFVINQQLPSSSYLTCIHWVLSLSYVEIAAADIETLFVHYSLRQDSMERRREWKKRQADFRPRSVYGRLTPWGLALSVHSSGPSTEELLTEPNWRNRRGSGSGRGGTSDSPAPKEEVEPLLQSQGSISPTWRGSSRLGGGSGSQRLAERGRLSIGRTEREGASGRRLSSSGGETSSERTEEGSSSLGRRESDDKERLQKLMGKLEETLPSKEVVLRTVLEGSSWRGEEGQRIFSRKHFNSLKAIHKKLPRKTIFRRLSSARRKIQEQESVEEVSEGVLVIDQQCLVAFPIFYVVSVLLILGNFVGRPA